VGSRVRNPHSFANKNKKWTILMNSDSGKFSNKTRVQCAVHSSRFYLVLHRESAVDCNRRISDENSPSDSVCTSAETEFAS
jgi:hypothetical protein